MLASGSGDRVGDLAGCWDGENDEGGVISRENGSLVASMLLSLARSWSKSMGRAPEPEH